MTSHISKILIIDDEDDIRLLLSTRLRRAGFEPLLASDGREGLRRFYSDRPDLVVLDVAMPEMDGWQVLERLREVSDVPVLMLTAAAQEREKLRGLRQGADDYVTKPFSGEELVARVQALLRRAAITPNDEPTDNYRDAEVSIDFRRHEVMVRGEEVELSPTEFRLLDVLTRHANQVLSQDQILNYAWGQEYLESADVVRLYVGYLRRKVEDDPKNPKLIETVRGFGYLYRRP